MLRKVEEWMDSSWHRIHWAAFNHDHNQLKTEIQKLGPNLIDLRSKGGQTGKTALHYALQSAKKSDDPKSYQCVKTLLESKASVNTVDKDGRTAMDVYLLHSHAASIGNLLLSSGSEMGAPPRPDMLYHCAANTANQTAVQFLIDVNCQVSESLKGELRNGKCKEEITLLLLLHYPQLLHEDVRESICNSDKTSNPDLVSLSEKASKLEIRDSEL